MTGGQNVEFVDRHFLRMGALEDITAEELEAEVGQHLLRTSVRNGVVFLSHTFDLLYKDSHHLGPRFHIIYGPRLYKRKSGYERTQAPNRVRCCAHLLTIVQRP